MISIKSGDVKFIGMSIVGKVSVKAIVLLIPKRNYQERIIDSNYFGWSSRGIGVTNQNASDEMKEA